MIANVLMAINSLRYPSKLIKDCKSRGLPLFVEKFFQGIHKKFPKSVASTVWPQFLNKQVHYL
jgi:hypothetical protein